MKLCLRCRLAGDCFDSAAHPITVITARWQQSRSRSMGRMWNAFLGDSRFGNHTDVEFEAETWSANTVIMPSLMTGRLTHIR